MSVDPDLNSGRVSQPGGVALPVLSLAGAQDEAAVEPVMDVGVLIEPEPEPEPEPEVAESEPEPEPEPEVAEPAAPKKRGRPRKVVVDEPVTEDPEGKED